MAESPAGIHLKELDLDSKDDGELLQRLLASVPGYWTLIEGGEVSAQAAVGTLAALPPLREFTDKRVFAICENGVPIGCIDVIRGYPNRSTAMLGLLLISEARQRTGLGTTSFELLRTWIAGAWPELEQIRIGVVAVNADAIAFWKRLGFRENGEKRKYHAGTVESETVVLVRGLS